MSHTEANHTEAHLLGAGAELTVRKHTLVRLVSREKEQNSCWIVCMQAKHTVKPSPSTDLVPCGLKAKRNVV